MSELLASTAWYISLAAESGRLCLEDMVEWAGNKLGDKLDRLTDVFEE